MNFFPVVIIAKQRSGTNLLRRTLSSSNIFSDFNEIFHSDGPGSFWKFYAKLIKNRPELSFPNKKNQIEVFNLFLNQVKASSSARFALLDIKYNSTHNLNHVWQSPVDSPFLLQLLADRNIPVIHLIRNNVFETYVSSIVANKLKMWVAKDTVTKNPKIKIQVPHMMKELNRTKDEINLYKKWLDNVKSLRNIEIAYESLIDEDGKFSKQVINKICDFLDIDDRLEVEIKTKKIANHPSKIVENYEREVEPALVEHGFI